MNLFGHGRLLQQVKLVLEFVSLLLHGILIFLNLAATHLVQPQ